MPEAKELHTQFVLASSSLTRYRLLRDAGYLVETVAADVDEASIRSLLKKLSTTPNEAATKLSREKASTVSKAYPGVFVLAADQILTCDGRWFSKPLDKDAAQEQLSYLSGKRHILHTSVCLISSNTQLWTHTENSYLTMRDLSTDFIKKYLHSVDSGAFSSAGCYQLENQGSQLFDCIEGDFFSILGLPLIPTMRQLRENEIEPL